LTGRATSSSWPPFPSRKKKKKRKEEELIRATCQHLLVPSPGVIPIEEKRKGKGKESRLPGQGEKGEGKKGKKGPKRIFLSLRPSPRCSSLVCKKKRKREKKGEGDMG